MPASNAATRISALLCCALALLGALFASPARAQIGSERYSSIVIDAASGAVLSAVSPDEMRFPASLTKMMTLYLLFEAIRDRRVTLGQYVPVSMTAASMSPTKLGLVPGSLITVEQAILGLVTKSANDAACALGEMLGGDEDRFAQMMTLRAHALGMTRTTFRNASGLPDWNQVTTARDMATLARRLVQDFPSFYHYFSTPYFVFAGRMVRSHQHLLTTYPGADGLKTGYTEAAGYNVATSALHGDTRLIGVVLGAGGNAERDAHMAGLLDQGFDRMGVPPVLVARLDRSFIAPAGANVVAAQVVAPPAPGSRWAPHGRQVRVSYPAARRTPDYRPEPAGRRIPDDRSERMQTHGAIRTTPAVQVVRPGPQVPTSQTRTAHGTGSYRYPG